MTSVAFTHVGICVRDLERSLRFWQEAMGFSRTGELRIGGEPTATLLGLPELDLEAVYLARGDCRIELLHYPTPGCEGEGELRPMNRCGLTHFAFRAENLEATLALVREHGGRVLEETHIRNPDFEAQVVFVTDPDGTRIEFVEAPGDPQAVPSGPASS